LGIALCQAADLKNGPKQRMALLVRDLKALE
jgi:hypothetical protein